MKRQTLNASLVAGLLAGSASAQAAVQSANPEAAASSNWEQRFEERALRTRGASYLKRFDGAREDGDCRTHYQVRLKNGNTECIRIRQQ